MNFLEVLNEDPIVWLDAKTSKHQNMPTPVPHPTSQGIRLHSHVAYLPPSIKK